jgi:hypothetical protein
VITGCAGKSSSCCVPLAPFGFLARRRRSAARKASSSRISPVETRPLPLALEDDRTEYGTAVILQAAGSLGKGAAGHFGCATFYILTSRVIADMICLSSGYRSGIVRILPVNT